MPGSSVVISYDFSLSTTSTAGVSSDGISGTALRSERPQDGQKPRPKSSNSRSISPRRVSNGCQSSVEVGVADFSCLIGSLATVSATLASSFGEKARYLWRASPKCHFPFWVCGGIVFYTETPHHKTNP